MGTPEKKQRMVMTYEVIGDDITALSAARLLMTWMAEEHATKKVIVKNDPLGIPFISLEKNGKEVDPEGLETAERALGLGV